jgi:hypothetical protein
MEQQDYTPEEARAVLNMPRSTFFKEVEKGNVPSIRKPGKKRRRRYPKEAIDAYAAFLTRSKRPAYDLSFIKATNADIWEAIENARNIYENDDIIPFGKVLEWRSINDEMTMCIKDHDQFAGCSTMMPLDENIIKLVLQDKIRERDIPTSAVRAWSDPELSVYIASIAIVSSGNKQKDTYRGRFLLDHTIRWAMVLYQQYDIRRFYALGTTPVGQELLGRLGFTEIINLEQGKRKGYLLEGVSKPATILTRILSEVTLQIVSSDDIMQQQN